MHAAALIHRCPVTVQPYASMHAREPHACVYRPLHAHVLACINDRACTGSCPHMHPRTHARLHARMQSPSSPRLLACTRVVLCCSHAHFCALAPDGCATGARRRRRQRSSVEFAARAAACACSARARASSSSRSCCHGLRSSRRGAFPSTVTFLRPPMFRGRLSFKRGLPVGPLEADVVRSGGR